MQFEKGINVVKQVEIIGGNIDIASTRGLLAFVVIFIILSIVASVTKDNSMIQFALISAAMFGIIVGIYTYENVPTDEYQYHVRLDEKISIDEFYNKYEVIEQIDDIYIIELKQE